MKIKQLQEAIQNSSVESYLKRVTKLIWKPVSTEVWNSIQDEGLDEEQNKPLQKSWLMAELLVDDNDIAGLKALSDETIEKFNLFDIKLKELSKNTMIDLIDYDNGTIKIVKAIKF